MNIKGSLPLLILHLLSHEPRHGYDISKFIRETSGGVLDFREGTLYPTLHNLEKNGYVASYEEIANGRKRRYYCITPNGETRVHTERGEWSAFVNAVNKVLDIAPPV